MTTKQGKVKIAVKFISSFFISVSMNANNSLKQAAFTIHDENIKSVSIGLDFACVLKLDGKVKCWENEPDRDIPIEIEDRKFKKLEAGLSSSCAIDKEDNLHCWGWKRTKIKSMLKEVNVKKVKDVGVMRHFIVGIHKDGSLFLFTNRNYNFEERHLPFNKKENKFKSVQAGWSHYCGLREDETLFCGSIYPRKYDTSFGKRNDYGQSDIPKNLKNKKMKKVSVGAYHTCVISADDELSCWGNGKYKQSHVPKILKKQKIKSIYSGGNRNCAVPADKQLVCWGERSYDVGTKDYNAIPNNFKNTTFKNISLSKNETCGVTESDKLACWGFNKNKHLIDIERIKKAIKD